MQNTRSTLECFFYTLCSNDCFAFSIVFALIAAGILSLLAEPEVEVKVFALQRLDELVDCFWAEIADRVSKLCVRERANV